jgi:Uma2 family endonuclease
LKIIDPREPGIVSDPVLVRQLMEERARLGIDMFDEVWDGVLHMNPPPFGEHGNIEIDFTIFVGALVRERGLGWLAKAGVRPAGSGVEDFRVPDLMFTSTARGRPIEWCEGGPEAVVEIRSPGDDTYKKLAFYAKLRVREVIVIDRDTRVPEIFRLDRDRMVPAIPGPGGSLLSETMQIVLRRVDGREGRGLLEVCDARDPARRCTI